MLSEILSRVSVRNYLPTDVPDGHIEKLIESARLAPSGSNTQPWHFIIVRSQKTRRRLAEVNGNQMWMTSAPVHIACVADIRCRVKTGDITLDENSGSLELKRIIRDTAIAAEHIVLQAEHLGLGTCWTANFVQSDVRPVLNVPEDKYVVCVLTVGYPAEKKRPPEKRETASMLHYEQW